MEAARAQWWAQVNGQLETLQQAVNGEMPGSLALETIYAPMHDMAGLAGVLGYPLLGKIARGLIETLRKVGDPLHDKMLMIARAHLAALVALHAKDVRGDGGPQGVANPRSWPASTPDLSWLSATCRQRKRAHP